MPENREELIILAKQIKDEIVDYVSVRRGSPVNADSDFADILCLKLAELTERVNKLENRPQ